jgi:hypothetical protein
VIAETGFGPSAFKFTGSTGRVAVGRPSDMFDTFNDLDPNTFRIEFDNEEYGTDLSPPRALPVEPIEEEDNIGLSFNPRAQILAAERGLI